jgi:hypothetical protein
MFKESQHTFAAMNLQEKHLYSHAGCAKVVAQSSPTVVLYICWAA